MDKKKLLMSSPAFKDLDDGQADRVLDLASVAQYDAGDSIFWEKDAANRLYVVDSGKVALQMSVPVPVYNAGRRLTMDIITETGVFGWSAVVDSHPYSLTAVCIERASVLEIDGKGLRLLLEKDTSIGYRVMNGLIRLVASRLDETRHLLMSERMTSEPVAVAPLS